MMRRLLLVAVVCVVGCGPKATPPGTLVRGQVLHRGVPVSGGMVVFAPDGERGTTGPLVSATLQADGSFTLLGEEGKPVPPGWYRIAVAPKAGSVPPPTVDNPHPGLPTKYRNPALSGLEREIKSASDNLILLDLD